MQIYDYYVMVDDLNYKEYKKIKTVLGFCKKDVEYSHILAEDILRLVYTTEKIRFGETMKNFFRSIDVSAFDCNTSALFTDALKRKDHLELLELVKKEVPNATHIHIDTLKLKLVFNFSSVFSSLRFILNKTNRKLHERLFLASKLSYYQNIMHELSTTFDSKKILWDHYIAFHAAYGIETLFTQFFRSKNITTYTLSHGISYVNYRKTVALDVVNGENITADIILVWGNSSKRDLIQNFNIPEARIFVAGNPRYTYKKIKVKQSFRNGMILLGGIIYEKGNLEILAIANQLQIQKGIRFSVKAHPSLNKESYKKKCEQLQLDFVEDNASIQDVFKSDNYDFAIANNSTTYYESMYYNMVCFRYSPDENMEFTGLEDRFSDLNSLSNGIEFFSNMGNQILSKKIEELLVDVLGMGINNYGELLNKQ